MGLVLSCDDACASDLKVADLAAKYEIPCTFYWPVEWHSLAHENGYKPLDYNEAMIIARDFEIGSHTITHRHLTRINQFEAAKEIIGSKFMLERMFNKTIYKFAPPRGYTNGELTNITLNIYDSQRLTKGEGLVHVHPNSGANDNKPWRECITDKTEEIWGHSYDFDRFELWEELEEVLKEIATHGK